MTQYKYRDLDAVKCTNCDFAGFVRDCILDNYKYEYVEAGESIVEYHQIVKCPRCTAIVTVYGMAEITDDSTT